MSIAQVVGLAVLRLADADVVPLHYEPYATEVGTYLNELSGQQDDVFGREVVNLDREGAGGRVGEGRGRTLQGEIDDALHDECRSAELNAFTKRLERVERELLVSRGLPGRPWFRHQIYAPGVNSGYGTQELPAINDALFLHSSPAQAKWYKASLFRSLRAVTRTLGG